MPKPHPHTHMDAQVVLLYLYHHNEEQILMLFKLFFTYLQFNKLKYSKLTDLNLYQYINNYIIFLGFYSRTVPCR